MPRSTLILTCICGLVCGGAASPPVAPAATTDAEPQWKKELEQEIQRQMDLADEGYAPPAGIVLQPGETLHTVAIWIPGPMNERDVDRIEWILSLSDEQRHAFDALFGKYVEDDRALREKRVRPLYLWSSNLVERGSPANDPILAEEFVRLMKEREMVLRELAGLENGLFDHFMHFLSESQVAQVGRVRDFRVRRRAMLYPRGLYELTGASVDLSDLFFRLHDRESLEILDPESFQALQSSYESTLTYLRRQHFNAYVNGHTEGIRYHAVNPKLPPKDDPAYAATLQTARAMRQDFQLKWRPAAVFERRIHELNNSYVELFASAMEDKSAVALRAAYYDRAYPLVFPNEFDAESIVRKIMTESNASDEQEFTLEALLDGYREKRDRVSKQMMQRSDDWFERSIRLRAYRHSEREEFRAEMREMEARRRGMALDLLETCKDFLGDRLPAPCATAIAAFEKKAEEAALNPPSFEGRN